LTLNKLAFAILSAFASIKVCSADTMLDVQRDAQVIDGGPSVSGVPPELRNLYEALEMPRRRALECFQGHECMYIIMGAEAT
jgi:hypothetical protein